MKHGMPKQQDWAEIEALVEPLPFNLLPSRKALYFLFGANFEEGVLYHKWTRGGIRRNRIAGYDCPFYGPIAHIYGRKVKVSDILYKMYRDVESRKIIHLNDDVHDNRICNLCPIEESALTDGGKIPDLLSDDEKPSYEPVGFLPLPTNDILYYHFTPDFEAGVLYWKNLNPRSKNKVGDVAGYKRANGVHRVKLNGVTYERSRIIYKMYHGTEPEMLIRLNLDPSDDSIDNLEEGDHSDRELNESRPPRKNKEYSAERGISWDKRVKRWRVMVQVHGVKYFLGYFEEEDKELAEAVVRSFRRRVKKGNLHEIS